MLVKDVMNTDVKTISKGSSIQEAAQLMSDSMIGSLIVTDDTRVIGILTERDIMKKVVAAGIDCKNTQVEKVMTKEVIMVEPDIDIKDAADIMIEHRIKKLPVIKDDSLVGILTLTDLVGANPSMVERFDDMLQASKKRAVAG